MGWLRRWFGGGRRTTALHATVDSCDVEGVRRLLARRPDLEARDAKGNTPLRLATSVEIARMLLAAGADLQTSNDEGLTPLHRAAFSASPGLVALYLEMGLPVDAVATTAAASRMTPLVTAGTQGHVYQMALLLVHGADASYLYAPGISYLRPPPMQAECRLLAAVTAVAGSADEAMARRARSLRERIDALLRQVVLTDGAVPGDTILYGLEGGQLHMQWESTMSRRCSAFAGRVRALKQEGRASDPDLWTAIDAAESEWR